MPFRGVAGHPALRGIVVERRAARQLMRQRRLRRRQAIGGNEQLHRIHGLVFRIEDEHDHVHARQLFGRMRGNRRDEQGVGALSRGTRQADQPARSRGDRQQSRFLGLENLRQGALRRAVAEDEAIALDRDAVLLFDHPPRRPIEKTHLVVRPKENQPEIHQVEDAVGPGERLIETVDPVLQIDGPPEMPVQDGQPRQDLVIDFLLPGVAHEAVDQLAAIGHLAQHSGAVGMQAPGRAGLLVEGAGVMGLVRDECAPEYRRPLPDGGQAFQERVRPGVPALFDRGGDRSFRHIARRNIAEHERAVRDFKQVYPGSVRRPAERLDRPLVIEPVADTAVNRLDRGQDIVQGICSNPGRAPIHHVLQDGFGRAWQQYERKSAARRQHYSVSTTVKTSKDVEPVQMYGSLLSELS